MSTKDNEVNRTIDGESTEGHRFRGIVEQAEDAGKKASKRTASLDDDAEGHKAFRLDEEAGKKASKRTAHLDDEAEGHKVLRLDEDDETARRI
jgi:hypothetical protein